MAPPLIRHLPHQQSITVWSYWHAGPVCEGSVRRRIQHQEPRSAVGIPPERGKRRGALNGSSWVGEWRPFSTTTPPPPAATALVFGSGNPNSCWGAGGGVRARPSGPRSPAKWRCGPKRRVPLPGRGSVPGSRLLPPSPLPWGPRQPKRRRQTRRRGAGRQAGKQAGPFASASSAAHLRCAAPRRAAPRGLWAAKWARRPAPRAYS